MKKQEWSGEEIQRAFPTATNLLDLIRSAEEQVVDEGRVVCEIFVNGTQFSEKDEGRWASEPIGSIHKFAVGTESVDVLLVDTIESAKNYVNQLSQASLIASERFRAGQLPESREIFGTVVDGASWLLEMVDQIRRVAGEKDWRMNRLAWDEAEEALKKQTRELLTAFEAEDFVLVADLLEYDWTSGLELWLKYLSTIEPGSQDGSSATESTLG